MEREEENKNGSYTKKETITQTPEDGFVPESVMKPTDPASYGKYQKGYGKTITYATNDPRITRPFIYGICGLFFTIGMIFLLFHIWIMGLPVVAMASFGFYKSKKDIDRIADELKKKGQDVTMDTKEEKKEVGEEIAESIQSGFKEAQKATLTEENYHWFLKATIPIYSIIVIFITGLVGLLVSKLIAFILLVVLASFGMLYYKIIKKIFKYGK